MKITIDSRLKSKIEELTDYSKGENACYMVRFKDLDDAFWFSNDSDLYKFMAEQVSERFYDKELRKGYFDYENDEGETIRYHYVVKRGSFTSVIDNIL